VDEQSSKGLLAGAYDYLTKPVTEEHLKISIKRLREYIDRRERRVLIIEDDEMQRKSLVELLGNKRVGIVQSSTAKTGLRALRQKQFDCLIVDLSLPDMEGSRLVTKIRGTKEGRDIPIIIFTGKEISGEERRLLSSRMCSVVAKGEGAPEALLETVYRHLNLPWEVLSITQQVLLAGLREKEPILAGKTILIVDDDVRNLFAMTSLLERYGVRVRCAENGRQGLDAVTQAPRPDLVLMDLMMPGMDGYETIRRIRRMKHLRRLPVVALTAKALPADRAKCLKAGASDYIRKPVEMEQLLALLRVWLDRAARAERNGVRGARIEAAT
jgi:hypothetical protein